MTKVHCTTCNTTIEVPPGGVCECGHAVVLSVGMVTITTMPSGAKTQYPLAEARNWALARARLASEPLPAEWRK